MRGARFFDVRVRPTAATAQAQRLLTQLPKRLAAMQALLAYRAADAARLGILDRTRGTDLGKGYEDGLQVARLAGSKTAFALRIKARARRVRAVDAKKTILLVQARRSRLVPPKPEVLVLAGQGPWTMDTLPFMPRTRDATLLSRRVSAAEAKRIEDRQRDPAQVLKVKRLLAEAGFIDRRKELKVETPPVVRAVPDLAYAALRAEFGADEGRNPHWRPTLRDVRGPWLKRQAKFRPFKDLLTKPRFAAWKRWPPRVRAHVTLAEAKTFAKFEKHLRVR